MSGRSVLTHLISGMLGIGAGVGALWFVGSDKVKEASRISRRLALVQSENERLRELVEKDHRAKVDAESKTRREAIERAVEEIRGLKFKETVDYNVLSRKEIKDVVSG